MIKVDIKIPIYECKINFSLCNKEEAIIVYNKICKKHKIKQEEFNFYGMVIPVFTSYYIIIIKEGNFINSFYHELFHCTELICNDREIEDSEAKAYLQGLIGEKLHKYII